jgi:hypothetical protein
MKILFLDSSSNWEEISSSNDDLVDQLDEEVAMVMHVALVGI